VDALQEGLVGPVVGVRTSALSEHQPGLEVPGILGFGALADLLTDFLVGHSYVLACIVQEYLA
jgi:hypothetical protein